MAMKIKGWKFSDPSWNQIFVVVVQTVCNFHQRNHDRNVLPLGNFQADLSHQSNPDELAIRQKIPTGGNPLGNFVELMYFFTVNNTTVTMFILD